jgi:hypothetical protein
MFLASSGRKLEDLVNKSLAVDLYWAKEWQGMLEMDMFDSEAAKEILQNISSEPTQRKLWLHRLMWMSTSCEFLYVFESRCQFNSLIEQLS